MRYVTAAEMRAIDSETRGWDPLGRGFPLMRTAARGLAGYVEKIGCGASLIICVVGRGNNGGDALLAGLELRRKGFDTVFFAAFERGGEHSGLAEVIAEENAADEIIYAGSALDWEIRCPSAFPDGVVIIDGILGIGARSAPAGMELAAVEWIRRMRNRGVVVAVDLPSGLDPDSGLPFDADAVVAADFTICMGMPKIGMFRREALDCCGSIHLADIGVDEKYRHASPDERQMITVSDVRGLLPEVSRETHKGDFGHVCIFGGSHGFLGAPVMAGLGALRGGAGLVSLILPESGISAALAAAPELMAMELPNGEWTPENVSSANVNLYGKVAVAGPGMGTGCDGGKDIRDTVAGICASASSVILDADALNAYSGIPEKLRDIVIPMVLTPHPGEAARLLSCSARDIQNDRESAIVKLVSVTGAAVVLKGAGTLVCAPGRGVSLIPCGNPRMACGGGMGDVLSGIIGAMLARGLGPYDAACAGAWLHAAAGDAAAWEKGLKNFTAVELADKLEPNRYG